jgi:hypothetical protein
MRQQFPGSWSSSQLTVARGVLALALGAVVFQVVHFLEHALQLGYLAAHPAAPAWLTPWAEWARDLMAAAVLHDHASHTHSAQAGGELLHLAGNGVFFLGLLALPLYWRMRGGGGFHSKLLRTALLLQGAHVAEHILLTGSVLALGEPLGISTGFGMVPAGAGATWYRVVVHFSVNLAASVYAVLALLEASGWWPTRSAIVDRGLAAHSPQRPLGRTERTSR